MTQQNRAQQNRSGLIGAIERLLAGGALLFLVLGAGMALLLTLNDPNAPGRCLAGGTEGWLDTILCLNRAGYGPSARLALGGIGVGLFAGLLSSLRSRAEDRALADTIQAVLAASTEARRRETA
jgi:hypothetical protein